MLCEESISTAPGWAKRPRYVRGPVAPSARVESVELDENRSIDFQAHETKAGAVADCFKHLLLVALLQGLQAR